VPERFGLALTGGLGSQGKRYLAFQHANRYERLGYVVAGGLNRTDRGFSYRDTLDSTRTRVNSDLSHEDLMFKGTYGTGSHGFSLLGEYGQTRRGEPGPTYWPSDSARMDDSRGIAHLGYDLVESDNASLEAKLYHHEFWRHFWNPDSFSPANDTHTTTVTGLTLKQSIHLERWATAVAGLEADQEAFRSTAIGVPKRTTGSGWLEARLAWLGLDITPMARFDWLRNEKPMPDSSVLLTNTRVLSPKLAVTWSGPRWLTVYASGSRSFRAPTFNELYWPKDQWTSGNPHLKPEWATSADLAATLGFGSHLNARVGGWYTRLTDLILWQPDSNYVFSPVNVDTATITGGELELATGFRHGGVVGTTTWMSSRAHGKDLIYRPRLTFSVFHWLSWDWVGLNWTVRHTGQRYTQSDNSDSLPAFLTFDLGASLNPHWGRLKPALRGGVRNLFDKQHEVMKGYPVPGRNWYAELELGL
jgi:outer membrane receptor protein involved in Fe transport